MKTRLHLMMLGVLLGVAGVLTLSANGITIGDDLENASTKPTIHALLIIEGANHNSKAHSMGAYRMYNLLPNC